MKTSRIPYKPAGKYAITLFCPFHKEGKVPNLVVYTDDGHFHCFSCLDVNELIWAETGLKKIGKVEIGEKVLTHKGSLAEITEKRTQINRVLSISTASFKEGLKVTKNHTFLRIPLEKANSISPNLLNTNRDCGATYRAYTSMEPTRLFSSPSKLETCLAEDLKLGDFIFWPIISEKDRRITPLKHEVRAYTSGPRVDRLRELPITKNLAWFYGLWIAEGGTNRGFVHLTCHIKEKDTLLKKAQEIVKKELKLKSTIIPYPEKNSAKLIISKTDLVEQLSYWFGKGVYEKRIPASVIWWPIELQTALLNGYYDGDGDSKTQSWAPTVSKQLAYSLYALLIQAGGLPCIRPMAARTDIDGVFHRKYWIVRRQKSPRAGGFIAEVEGVSYYVTQILKIKKLKRPRKVVDISVDKINTFVTKLGAVHNCNVHGSWNYLAQKLNIEKLSKGIIITDNTLKVLEDYLKDLVTKDPCLPYKTVDWKKPHWRKIDRKTLLSVSSRWWFDDLDQVARIVWPVWNSNSELVGWVGRRLDNDIKTRKYRNAPAMEVLSTLWPLPTTIDKNEDLVFLVEGPYDALRLLQEGIPALALLGTRWSRDRDSLLSFLNTKTVVLALDSDAPGQKATWSIGYRLERFFGESNIKIWEWKEKDAGEASKETLEKLKRLLELKKLGPHRWLTQMPKLDLLWFP